MLPDVLPELYKRLRYSQTIYDFLIPQIFWRRSPMVDWKFEVSKNHILSVNNVTFCIINKPDWWNYFPCYLSIAIGTNQNFKQKMLPVVTLLIARCSHCTALGWTCCHIIARMLPCVTIVRFCVTIVLPVWYQMIAIWLPYDCHWFTFPKGNSPTPPTLPRRTKCLKAKKIASVST